MIFIFPIIEVNEKYSKARIFKIHDLQGVQSCRINEHKDMIMDKLMLNGRFILFFKSRFSISPSVTMQVMFYRLFLNSAT